MVALVIAGRRLAERLEQGPERVELGAEAGPVSRLQAFDRAVVMGERLAGVLVRRANGTGTGTGCARRRWNRRA